MPHLTPYAACFVSAAGHGRQVLLQDAALYNVRAFWADYKTVLPLHYAVYLA